MEEKRKKLEVVSGNGSNLDISPVHENINEIRPTHNKKPENVVIPKSKKAKGRNENRK